MSVIHRAGWRGELTGNDLYEGRGWTLDGPRMTQAVLDRRGTLSTKLAERIHQDEARDRIVAALAAVGASALYPARTVSITDDVRGPVYADALDTATRAALGVLASELARAVDALGTPAVNALMTEQLVADLASSAPTNSQAPGGAQ